jgi:hypothetical protein
MILTRSKERQMTATDVIEDTASTTLKGLVHEKNEDLRDRVEPPADRLKDEAADRVEGVAKKIRSLGDDHDRRDEADAIARRLERTADYLRFRPAAHVASDVRDTLTRPGVLWFAGGALATLTAFHLIRRASSNR